MNHKSDHNLEFKKELEELKDNIHDLKELVIKKVSKSAQKVPEAIHENEEKVAQRIEEHPFSSVGIAAAVGFVLGALFTRK